MKFKANRKITIAALGHVASFDKDEVKSLPPALHEQAMLQGLEPLDKKAAPNVSKADDSVRVTALVEAMKAIAANNTLSDFDAAGIPKAKVVQTAAGHDFADNKERLALWAEVVRSTEA